ncbi:MAG TPA: SDR family NAD(P)-dependent oxidoreductase [Vicinamibacterales bacterium]
MPRILVTGAAGFAGSHLVDALARTGAEVIAWARRAERLPDTDIHMQAVDLLDRRAVAEAMAAARPDVVYHCAGAAQSGSAWDRIGTTLETNVMGTAHLLEALRASAPRARVVVTGSALVYRPTSELLTEASAIGPVGPYAVSKLAQEMLALRAAADDLDVVVARSFNHIGPRQSPAFVASSVARQLALIEAGQSPPELLVGNLDASRDLTDVRDTVRAYIGLAAKGRRGEVYNVCSGRAVLIRDLVEALVQRTRVPVALVRDPARYRPVDVPVVVGSHARLSAETGWKPEIPLDRTLDDILDWWRRRTGASPARQAGT